jgi:hypothetical protein
MRPLSFALIATAATLTACSSESRLTGSYIDTDYSDGVLMVQIDSVDHRDVHGTISIASFGENGTVSSRRVPISGTIEGKALNLTVENGTGINMLNGTVVADGLDLTMMGNGSSARFLFKRKDAAEFNRVIASLRTQSARALQDKENAAFQVQQAKRGLQVQSQIDGHVDRLLSDAQAIIAKARQLDNAIAYYQRISARNAQLKAIAARVDSKSEDGSGRLGEIESRVDGNRNLAASAHSDVQDFLRDVEGQSEANLRRANEFMAECQSDSRLSCTKLASAVAEYGNSVSSLQSAAGRESAAYDTQRTRF